MILPKLKNPDRSDARLAEEAVNLAIENFINFCLSWFQVRSAT
jgi:hypothetical protein